MRDERASTPTQYPSLKLQQLRCLVAIVDSGLGVSTAARRLHCSQPAVSKHIRSLERELAVPLFVRSGRQFCGLTPTGQNLLEVARRIVAGAQQLSNLGARYRSNNAGVLSIGTTHTQARYVLPPIIQRYRRSHRDLHLQLHVGTSEQIADMARCAQIDFAMATGATELFPNWILLPLYRWNRCIIVPRGHALSTHSHLTLADLARYPLLTYSFNLFRGPSLLAAFAAAGLTADIAITAGNADVIKTYVRLGLGVGIVAEMAAEEADADLLRLDAADLLPEHCTWIGFSRDAVMHRYKHEFIAALAPHLSARHVSHALSQSSQAQVDALFPPQAIPRYQVAAPAHWGSRAPVTA